MNIVGVMSGTSLDGVDIALCNIENNSFKLIEFLEYPFTLKDEILHLINSKITLEEFGTIEYKLSMLYIEAIKNFKNSFDAIAIHGQTIWHNPNSNTPFTMQLINPFLLSTYFKVPVISNFREKDITLGGEGAPLAPAFHSFFFLGKKEPIVVVNIGGMANITLIEKSRATLGYDTGCGNVLLDIWIAKNLNKKYDKNGEWAKGGVLDKVLLKEMLKEKYFNLNYPKSTGRELFNLEWIEKYISKENPQNIQRTLLEVTAITIADEIKKLNPNSIIIAGGGAKNSFLIERLEALLNQKVEISNYANELEAMIFAWLGYKRLKNEKIDLRDITGAKEKALLGVIYE